MFIIGQYYKCVNLDKKQYIKSWDYDNGAKLMEHSWIGNGFMGIAICLLINDWHGDRIVWAGDYGDEGLFLDEFDEVQQTHNVYMYASECFEKINPAFDANVLNQQYPFIVNHDKQEYVDIRNCPKSEDDWTIHPLSLLTCSGNGRGGGDYRGNNNFVESWAGNRISVESEAPAGYEEIQPDFIE